MAESTTDERSDRQIDGLSQPSMHTEEPRYIPRYMRGHLSRTYDEYDVHQQIQIEQETIKFLKKCRKFKRPPQSIRISGANVVLEEEKLKYFSQFETTLLNHQILTKEKKIKDMRLLSENIPYSKLPATDRKKLYKHYRKKLKFYAIQNNTKWANWPAKEVLLSPSHSNKKRNKTQRNFKKRQKRRCKKTQRAAKKAIESGSVVVLVEDEVPLGAIVLLGKGLGFVPTPNPNPLEEQLQMRLTTNRILRASHLRTSEESMAAFEPIPAKLRHTTYTQRQPVSDRHVNTLVDRLVLEHNSLLKNMRGTKTKSNLSKDERDGLKWLQDMSKKEKISVVQADKGGAILIVPPSLLEKKVMEKLENPNIYTKIEADPLQNLKTELFELWKKGKIEGHVSQRIAYQVAGVTENNNMSTSPHFKPGVPYFYPILKIHKLRKEQLIPGVEPPARLVTSLCEGVSKRSDVYIADKFLKKLEKDFCADLLVDSSDALRWLENMNSSLAV